MTTTKRQRQRRYMMAKAYMDRHVALARVGRPAHIQAYRDWVRGFAKFMVIAYPGKLERII